MAVKDNGRRVHPPESLCNRESCTAAGKMMLGGVRPPAGPASGSGINTRWLLAIAMAQTFAIAASSAQDTCAATARPAGAAASAWVPIADSLGVVTTENRGMASRAVSEVPPIADTGVLLGARPLITPPVDGYVTAKIGGEWRHVAIHKTSSG